MNIYDVKPISEIRSMPGLFKPIQALSDRATLCLDIETSGLDPETDRIYMIGVKSPTITKIICDDDERAMLTKLSILLSIENVILFGHNLFLFDLPFLMKRAEIYNVQLPLRYRIRSNGEHISRSILQGGTYPLIFDEIEYAHGDIVDTLILARLNDARYLFKNHGLKNLAIEIGFRSSQRLELTHQEIKDCWRLNRSKLIEYLTYDLEDTQALFDKFVPAYYYMLRFLPMTLQGIILYSTARKITSLIEMYYKSKDPAYEKPLPSPKFVFKGGLTKCIPGLYKNVTKVDVSSQYPYIMLAYRLGPSLDKDPDGIFFSVLKSLRDERLKYKRQKDDISQAISEAMKININSAFGMLGCEHAPYNNPESAKMICTFGREIASMIIDAIQTVGGIVVEADTDGVIFYSSENIIDKIRDKMPAELELDVEYTADWMYADAAKNYIYKIGNKIIRKGKFRKRNAMRLFIEFHETFCEKWISSIDDADIYYNRLKEDLISGSMPIEKLKVHRTISKSEKRCTQYAPIRSKIDVYTGYDGRGKPYPVIEGPYHTEYYLKELEKWRTKIISGITPVG